MKRKSVISMSILLFLSFLSGIASLGVLLSFPIIFFLGANYFFFKDQFRQGFRHSIFFIVFQLILVSMFLFIDLICLIFLYYYVFLLNDLLFLFNHLNSLEQIYKDNFKFYVFMIIGIFLFIILGLWSKSENYFHDFHQVSESILESKHDSKLIGYLIGVPFSTFLITSSFAISQQLFYSNFVLQGLLSLFFGFLNIFIAFYLSGYKKWIMITENNIILKSSFFKKNLENRIYDKKDFFLSLVNKKILLIQDEKYFLESSYILIKPNQIFKIDSNITIHGDLEKIQKFVNLFKDYNIPTQESLVKSIEKEFEFRELLKLQKEKDRRT